MKHFIGSLLVTFISVLSAASPVDLPEMEREEEPSLTAISRSLAAESDEKELDDVKDDERRESRSVAAPPRNLYEEIQSLHKQGTQLSIQEKALLKTEMCKVIRNYFDQIISHKPFTLYDAVTLQNLTTLAFLVVTPTLLSFFTNISPFDKIMGGVLLASVNVVTTTLPKLIQSCRDAKTSIQLHWKETFTKLDINYRLADILADYFIQKNIAPSAELIHKELDVLFQGIEEIGSLSDKLFPGADLQAASAVVRIHAPQPDEAAVD